MQIECKKYAWLIISQDGNLGIVPQDSIDLELKDLQSAVGGYVEVVYPQIFRQWNPYLRMLVDENGLFKDYGLNLLASCLYGHDIVGDVVLCTTWNPDSMAEPDVYAMEFDEALKLKERLLRLSNRLQAAVSEQDARNAAASGSKEEDS